MNNILRLPKEFTTKWLEALRSGEYEQGIAQLLNIEYDGNKISGKYYCCLGVGLSLCGAEDRDIVNRNMPADAEGFKDFPDELYGEDDQGLLESLPTLFSKMNDGYGKPALDKIYRDFPQLTDKLKPVLTDSVTGEIKFSTYTFSEIANFIEQNFELY